MASEISKAQIDRLGDRLKKGNIKEDDLRLLDEYRRSFTEAYETVVGAIRNETALEPTGRPAKSTTSISEKLLRETIRLTQVQDIAGCRLIVSDMAEQERVVQSLGKLFDDVTIVDRREQPSHGYRAVHLIVKIANKLVEIQVRTKLQHLWAEQSEKLSDIIDPTIKYGGGDEKIRAVLTLSSDGVARHEYVEADLRNVQTQLSRIMVQVGSKADKKETAAVLQKRIEDIQREVIAIRQELTKVLQYTIDHAATLTGENDDIPD